MAYVEASFDHKDKLAPKTNVCGREIQIHEYTNYHLLAGKRFETRITDPKYVDAFKSQQTLWTSKTPVS